jgi:hypothetical protein
MFYFAMLLEVEKTTVLSIFLRDKKKVNCPIAAPWHGELMQPIESHQAQHPRISDFSESLLLCNLQYLPGR